jgi:hypothetical protein
MPAMPVKKHHLKKADVKPTFGSGGREDFLVATWNTAKDDKIFQRTRSPATFFAANANRHLILLQEAGPEEERLAEANGFKYIRMGKGLGLAWKDDKMHYMGDIKTDETIPGSGGGRNGVASCALFTLNKRDYKMLPVRVVNIHAGHNKKGEHAKSVGRIKAVWEALDGTPLNIIGGDMNECHACEEAEQLVGHAAYSLDITHAHVKSPDQLGALGRDVIDSITCTTGDNYGSDHSCKLLTIKLKKPSDFGGRAAQDVKLKNYCVRV